MNALFKEYYTHENCVCYKINNPWSKMNQDKMVLCREEKGLKYAKTIAIGVMVKWLIKSFENDVGEK